MSNERYKIVQNKQQLDEFIAMLPEEESDEFYYMSLMARCKDGSLPKVKNSEIYGTKKIVKRYGIYRALLEYEIPLGQYFRGNSSIDQSYLSPYITINPRSLKKASRSTCLNLMENLMDSSVFINPLDLAMCEIHKSVGTKNFLDFDFDVPSDTAFSDLFRKIQEVIRATDGIEGRKILSTCGGFHLICKASSVGPKYGKILELGCDVHGSNTMIPIPGCCQRNFIPTLFDPSIFETASDV